MGDAEKRLDEHMAEKHPDAPERPKTKGRIFKIWFYSKGENIIKKYFKSRYLKPSGY